MSGKTLTRADLAEAVFQKVGLPRNESAELVELVLREIVASLERGETVKLSSFGSLESATRDNASVGTQRRAKKFRSHRGGCSSSARAIS